MMVTKCPNWILERRLIRIEFFHFKPYYLSEHVLSGRHCTALPATFGDGTASSISTVFIPRTGEIVARGSVDSVTPFSSPSKYGSTLWPAIVVLTAVAELILARKFFKPTLVSTRRVWTCLRSPPQRDHQKAAKDKFQHRVPQSG